MRGSTPSTGARWFGVGCSTARRAGQAGAEAASAAQAGRRASLLLVFCSALYDAADLLEGVCSVTPDDVVVVGSTTMGELVSGNHNWAATLRPSVVVAALGGPGFEVQSTVVPQASADQRQAGVAAASVMDGVKAPNKVMLMLLDGLIRERHQLVRGAYSVLGAPVPIVGGCAADNLTYTLTQQFYGTGKGARSLSDSVVAIGLGSSGPLGVGLDHGWHKHGQPMVVTSSDEGEVFLIDNQPALDVYLRCMGADRSLAEDANKFREVAFDYPLGLSRGDGEDLRVIHSANSQRGSVSCLADVPQGALIWTMRTDEPSLIGAAVSSCQMALDGLGEAEPIGLLIFDCGARVVKLGQDNLGAEQDAVRSAVGAPFAGFYTYGEIARTRGSRGTHHLTVASLAIA
jgi:hypothetical protein